MRQVPLIFLRAQYSTVNTILYSRSLLLLILHNGNFMLIEQQVPITPPQQRATAILVFISTCLTVLDTSYGGILQYLSSRY